MGSILMRRLRKSRLMTFLVVGAWLSLFPFLGAANVFAYDGNSTGYAFGNATGASGGTLTLGYVANHPPACGDPLSNVAWGTQITIQNGPIQLISSSGTAYSQYQFYIEDNGDPACAEGTNWIDVYFGQYLFPGDVCHCPGSPDGNACEQASTNSCTNAANYGNHFVSYTSP